MDSRNSKNHAQDLKNEITTSSPPKKTIHHLMMPVRLATFKAMKSHYGAVCGKGDSKNIELFLAEPQQHTYVFKSAD